MSPPSGGRGTAVEAWIQTSHLQWCYLGGGVGRQMTMAKSLTISGCYLSYPSIEHLGLSPPKTSNVGTVGWPSLQCDPPQGVYTIRRMKQTWKFTVRKCRDQIVPVKIPPTKSGYRLCGGQLVGFTKNAKRFFKKLGRWCCKLGKGIFHSDSLGFRLELAPMTQHLAGAWGERSLTITSVHRMCVYKSTSRKRLGRNCQATEPNNWKNYFRGFFQRSTVFMRIEASDKQGGNCTARLIGCNLEQWSSDIHLDQLAPLLHKIYPIRRCETGFNNKLLISTLLWCAKLEPCPHPMETNMTLQNPNDTRSDQAQWRRGEYHQKVWEELVHAVLITNRRTSYQVK